MASPFDRAIKRANQSLYKAAGKPIVYRAGNEDFEIANAVQGATASELNDLNGVSVRTLQTDWLIPISALPFEPQPGHLITHQDGSKIFEFEVQNLGTEKCYRISGPLQDRYRIHVRQIGESDEE